MNRIPRYCAALLAIAGTAAFGAPGVGATIGAATGAASAATSHLGASSGSAGLGFGNTVSGATSATGAAPAGLGISATAGVHADSSGAATASAPSGLNTASTAAAVQGNFGAQAGASTRDLTVDELAQQDASASLNAKAVTDGIRQASIYYRDLVIKTVKTREEASQKALSHLPNAQAYAHAAANAQVKAAGAADTAAVSASDNADVRLARAMADVDSCRKHLNKSLHGVAAATDDTWEFARSKLASDYDAYAHAVVNAETAAGVTVAADDRT